jgi:hypothetical protein
MKKELLPFILSMLVFAIVLSGCGGNVPATSTNVDAPTAAATQEPASSAVASVGSPTADLCVSPQIEAEAQKVQKHMREFDDASILASSVPQAQLSTSIADLQRIRREADDEVIPACLTDLKNYQLSHMNSVINTLLAFMRSKDPLAIDCADIQSNTEEEAVCQNIALARQQHDQYLVELARVLGLTVMPATPGAETPPAETPTP